MQKRGVRPRLGVTMGDPAGIGPELVLRLLADSAVRETARLVVYGSATILRRVSETAQIPWPDGLVVVDAAESPTAAGYGHILRDFPHPGAATVRPGLVQVACGDMARSWIEAAARDAQCGAVDAIVTAPINKAAMHAAGVRFPGHTEMLAALTGADDVRMFFWSPSLAVGLVTIHIALQDVPAAVTRDAVLGTIRQVAGAIRGDWRRPPRIGVLALNPHAGEGGLFGTSEQTAILPAIQEARSEGINAEGPLVPDTAFRDDVRSGYDAFVAMYHDQGLIPFKMLAFDEGVNVTLGLPFCRTSPDHGTAFDIAWQGRASPASLLAAVGYARRQVLAGN